MYDSLADGWQEVLKNIDKALEASGGSESAGAKSAARSQFWGAQQRFFNQIMTSMQTPSVIRAMEEDIAGGKAPVVQLVNTMEAATKRALARRGEGDDLEEMDVSPREILMQYLEKSFPVHRHEKFVDENGNDGVRLVKDSNGDPIVDPEAAAIRDGLLDKVGTYRIPESPLDMILSHFGSTSPNAPAGPNGSSTRTRRRDAEEVLERAEPDERQAADTDAFQGGRKGYSSSPTPAGQGPTTPTRERGQHEAAGPLPVAAGWRADKAVRASAGRTGRTRWPCNTGSSRSGSLGSEAVHLDHQPPARPTRGPDSGPVQAGSAGLFSTRTTLESPEARDALDGVLPRRLRMGQIPG